MKLQEQMDIIRKKFICKSLVDHEWNVQKAADALGVTKQYLHRFVKQTGKSVIELHGTDISEFEIVEREEPACTPITRKVLNNVPTLFKSYEHMKDILGLMTLVAVVEEQGDLAAAALHCNETTEELQRLMKNYERSVDPIVKSILGPNYKRVGKYVKRK